MDVFVIPVGPGTYELYCESPSEDVSETPDVPPDGFVARLRYRFNAILRAAEERRHQPPDAPTDERSWLGRLQVRMMAWIAERIAEQRLLWNLRRETAAVVVHPQDMTFEQVMELVQRILRRDYDRHRLWLVLDSIGLIVSAALAIVPGPNVLAYYFLFRVGGHWLSMLGARQGMRRIVWTGRECPPLGELRELVTLEPGLRNQRVQAIAERLRLQHLSTFFDRVAVRHA